MKLLLVSTGTFVESDDKRVSITVEDNAGNRSRVWLDAAEARGFANEIIQAAVAITPDHGLLSRDECQRTECITHGVWRIGPRLPSDHQ